MSVSLSGLKILLVEDEFINAIFVADLLSSAGCEVVGPARNVAEATHFAEDPSLDGAILDVNLAGEAVYPVADRLVARQVPVMLTTGYEAGMLPERLRGCRRLQKPFGEQEFLDELQHLVARGRPASQS